MKTHIGSKRELFKQIHVESDCHTIFYLGELQVAEITGTKERVRLSLFV
jgi:hypothetical protein